MSRFSRWLFLAVVISVPTAAPMPVTAQAPFDPHVVLRFWWGEPSPKRAPEPKQRATEAERSEVDRVLAAWHAAEQKRPALVAKFWRYDVNPLLGGNPSSAEGEIRYVPPTLVSYEAGSEKWVYDGTAHFEFDPNRSTVREYRLNDFEFGAPVTAVPFPFLYGPDPEQMRIRYHMRPITPQGTVDQVWIEAVPRMGWEHAAFKRAEFILNLPDYRLYALNLIRDDQGQRTAYVFHECKTVDADAVGKTAWEIGQRRLVPLGWEHRVIHSSPKLWIAP
jgi:hypothetical protein